MRNFVAIEEKGSVREFIINDLSNIGLRIDTNKHRNIIIGQTSPHIGNNAKHQHGSRVFNVHLHQMDTMSIRIDDFDLTVPIFLRWCFDCIRRSIKHEGLFRKSGGSQRVKELMARIEDGSLTPSLSSSNTVFDVCSLFKEFLRRLIYPLITYPLQDLLLDCFSMRSIPSDKKVDIYFNILLLLPDEHLHALIYILRFLHEITLNERDNKMNAKNLAICVGPGIMRTSSDGKGNIMTEQCATSVSDIVETLISNASKLGYVTDSIYDRSQMLLEMRQKEAVQNTDDSFAIENGMKYGIGGGKMSDLANAKKRRSGSVKEFLVHMTNRLRRRSGSNNDSRDQTNAFLDQSGKLSSSHTRDHRYHYQQNSIHGHCLSSSATSSATTTKRKSSDDPNSSNSKRGKTKTSSQEKISLPNTNRFTSPITAFRRKKKTSTHSNDPGFPFKIEHSHLPQLLHFTDEVPVRFMNTVVNPTSSVSSGSVSSLSTATPTGSMTTLTTSMMSNNSTVHSTIQPLSMIPHEPPTLLSNLASISCNNKSLDTKKLNLLDSWKWPKSSRKAERKPLVAIHAPMLVASHADSSSLTELSPSPIKAINNSIQITTEQLGGTSLLMHSSFGVRRHSDDVTSTSFTGSTFRPRRSISSSGEQQQTRHVVCMLNNYSHSLPNQQLNTSDDDEQHMKNSNQESFSDDDEDIVNELNLAVVVGNEDGQSLKGFTNEQINNENGSLDVAFLDEADLERNLSNNNNKTTSENEQITTDVQILNSDDHNENETLLQTIIVERNLSEIKDNNQELIVPILVEKQLNKDDELDEILRRNENRCIRLTDSDDEDHENFNVKTTPIKTSEDNNNNKSTTPKMPVRLSSSISNLISSSSSLTALPPSISKERSLSCSISQPTNELFHTSVTKWTSLNLGENVENISVLNSGRDSILELKDELAGRVQKQVRAYEQHSSENIHNRSIVPQVTSQISDENKNIFTVESVNTPEQHIIEKALTRGNKIVLSGNGLGEAVRSVKRLRNTPVRRWKERVKEFEKSHPSTTSPYQKRSLDGVVKKSGKILLEVY
ncbi:unnamed protein product [Adineta steineri]|uniref:Rho-GAP domain-containing protein n=2 Tax=Adineta steineri TaxID=433720 RepID=A0A819DKH3_9BILA|nr:unnamed protein product [Adineta steineri]